MNYAALLHRPMSEFAHALDDHTYIFRLRTAREDVNKCTFYYADRAEMSPELHFAALSMPCVRRDPYYDWYEITLHTEYLRIAYYFLLESGEETCYYAGDCFETTATLSRSDYFQLPFNLRSDRLSIPDWVHDAVVYNIFPDSFADRKRHLSCLPSKADYQGEACHSLLGGTVCGIRENLDYIHFLGCNCIYLNPMFAANAYHKYDLIDYYHIDPTRGTDEEFCDMVRDAHEMGIRVIIDGVFNHVSWRHPFFQDVLQKGKASPYYDWFYGLPDHPRYPNAGEAAGYLCFSYVSEMPKMNTANPAVRDYFCKVGEYWIRKFDVDGWRLDVANEVDDVFLRTFRSAVKRQKPDALVIGEVWENANHYLLGSLLDSAMNYDFRRFCSQFFAKGTLDAAAFDLRVSQLLMRYPKQATAAQLNLLDSHDVSRFLTLCSNDPDRMELAVLFQMTFVGMPSVFYGDEKGLTGIAEREYRQAMRFDRQNILESVYRQFIALRREYPALRRGDFRTLSAQGMVYGFRRSYQGEAVNIYMNAGNTPVHLPAQKQILLQKGWDCGLLKAKGYVVSLEGSM